ncbi:acyl-homoserine-lactone synthase [Gayadomonas joobiniege]|uniref:acyl-homoserine-lactone synthase n=1 Tax=Gayadomonas joobiniege TaxID=1234606 RepID=UPI0003733DA2|nr:GNAT family N-acyltransferase [Gayadomonas joobiniege]
MQISACTRKQKQPKQIDIDPCAYFFEHFNIRIVSADQLGPVLNLRYKIYCEENDWVGTRYADRKIEKDEHDERALHCVIEHKDTKKPAAYVRLIKSLDGRLPISDHIHDFHATPNEWEISRLLVCSSFRYICNEVKITSLLFNALLLISRTIARHENIKSFYLIAEPRLVNVLVKMGYDLEIVSGPYKMRQHAKKGGTILRYIYRVTEKASVDSRNVLRSRLAKEIEHTLYPVKSHLNANKFRFNN